MNFDIISIFRRNKMLGMEIFMDQVLRDLLINFKSQIFALDSVDVYTQNPPMTDVGQGPHSV